MSYAKPGRLLLTRHVKRKEPKSEYLLGLEQRQAQAPANAKPDRSADPAFDDALLPGLLRAQG